MLAKKGIGWWYWLATAVLLAAYLAGLSGAREAVVALLVVQVVHFRWRGRSFLAFPVQVRVAYLALLIAGMAPHMVVLHWIQTIGVWAEVLAGYCLLARLLALLPWNRAVPLTLGVVHFVLFSPPGRGSILRALAGHRMAAAMPPERVT